jgi:hypothetical protein
LHNAEYDVSREVVYDREWKGLKYMDVGRLGTRVIDWITENGRVYILKSPKQERQN